MCVRVRVRVRVCALVSLFFIVSVVIIMRFKSTHVYVGVSIWCDASLWRYLPSRLAGCSVAGVLKHAVVAWLCVCMCMCACMCVAMSCSPGHGHEIVGAQPGIRGD